MTRTILILPLFALAACSQAPTQDEAEAPHVTERDMQAALAEIGENSLHPPDRDVLAEKIAAACPSSKPVGDAQCSAQGMGSHTFTCEYSLGDDPYLRHDAVLSEVDGEYQLVDPEKVCAQGA